MYCHHTCAANQRTKVPKSFLHRTSSAHWPLMSELFAADSDSLYASCRAARLLR